MADGLRRRLRDAFKPFIDVVQGVLAILVLIVIGVTGAGKVLRKHEIPEIRTRLEALPGVAEAKVANQVQGGGIGYYAGIDVRGVPDQSLEDALETVERAHAVRDAQRRKVVERSIVTYRQQFGGGEIYLRGEYPRKDQPDDYASRLRALFAAIEDGATWASSGPRGHVETRR